MKILKKIFIFYDTIRHLKFVQIFYRIFNIFEIKYLNQNKKFVLRKQEGAFKKVIMQKNTLVGYNRFLFLNEEGYIQENSWEVQDKSKLWKYNLHYFNFLNTAQYDYFYKKDALIVNWIKFNPPFKGVQWERYPTSIRTVNWIKWVLSGNEIDKITKKNLYTQASWIYKNPERHLLGNHYLSNLKALIFCGSFFYSKDSANWLIWAQKKIKIQLVEQILKDGGHFERSPMYHALVLEDVLDILNLSNVYLSKFDNEFLSFLKKTCVKMIGWLKFMIHQDGEISFFNDASFGIASSFEELLSYSDRLGIKKRFFVDKKKISIKHLKDSGYISIRSNKALVIIDVAKLGPDYLPAHGHADTLSFELSVFGNRIIVNGGTSCYENCERRNYERKTANHSTVEIDEEDSSLVWKSFRVGKRAYPKDLLIKNRKNKIDIHCSHTGYARLFNKRNHIRYWSMQEKQLNITDYVSGKINKAISRIIFHPDIQLTKTSDKSFNILTKSKKNINLEILKGSGEIKQFKYAIEFGKLLNTVCLEIQINKKSHFKMNW